MTIIGKRKSDEDQIACGFSFLALDEQTEPQTCTSSPRKIQRSRKESKDGNVQVYVWGLNDKDQLGGQKGSKVGSVHTSLAGCYEDSQRHYLLIVTLRFTTIDDS